MLQPSVGCVRQGSAQPKTVPEYSAHIALNSQHQIRTSIAADLSDETLFEQFLLGSEQAYVALYERYDKGILTYLRTVLKDAPDAADDLFQETFVKLFRERGRRQEILNRGEEYRPVQNFRGWLFRVAHNLAISFHRSNRPTVSLTPDDDEETSRWDERLMVPIEESFSQLYGEDDLFANETIYKQLRVAIELLPQSLRDVFVLREVNGMEYEEVAATVGCTQEAARMRISRARRALRKALEKFLVRDE